MPFHPIVHTVKIELVGHDTVTLTPIVNVMHGNLDDDAPTSAETLAIAQATHDVVVTTDWRNAVVSNMTYDYVRVTSLQAADSPQSTVPFAPGITGDGDLGIAGVCAIQKLTSIERERTGRGRIFLPMAPSDSVSSANVISDSQRGRVNTAVTALRTALQALTPACDLVVASRKLGVSFLLVSDACEALVAFQRRRGMR
jgi:hypothetical protein